MKDDLIQLSIFIPKFNMKSEDSIEYMFSGLGVLWKEL
jgi:hypothetical protein